MCACAVRLCAVRLCAVWPRRCCQVRVKCPCLPLWRWSSGASPCARLHNKRRRVYCGMLVMLDAAIGRLTHLLESEGLMDNTIIGR